MSKTNINRLKKSALILALLYLLYTAPVRAQSNGIDSVTFGIGCYATGNYSIAGGENSWAIGTASSAIGLSATATGDYSFASGYMTLASQFASTASGEYSMATGPDSDAFGLSTTTIGPGSMAFGFCTTASGYYSAASGVGSSASGYGATAAGNDTNASAWSEFAVGSFNAINTGNPNNWVPTDPIFEVGNGYYPGVFGWSGPAVYSDALVVYKNGNTTITGTLSISGDNAVLVNQTGDISMGGFTAGPTPAPGPTP